MTFSSKAGSRKKTCYFLKIEDDKGCRCRHEKYLPSCSLLVSPCTKKQLKHCTKLRKYEQIGNAINLFHSFPLILTQRKHKNRNRRKVQSQGKWKTYTHRPSTLEKQYIKTTKQYCIKARRNVDIFLGFLHSWINARICLDFLQRNAKECKWFCSPWLVSTHEWWIDGRIIDHCDVLSYCIVPTKKGVLWPYHDQFVKKRKYLQTAGK